MTFPLIVALLVLLIVGFALWRALQPRKTTPQPVQAEAAEANPSKSSVPQVPVGKAPMAPRLPRPAKPVDPNASLVKSYQAVLAKRSKPAKRGTPRSKMSVAQAIQLVVETDQFTLLGGRPLGDLPSPKAKIEDALKQMIGKTEDEKLRNGMSRALLDLAKFQDIEACKASRRNPYDLYQRELARLQGDLEKLLEGHPTSSGMPRSRRPSRRKTGNSETE